MSSTIVRGQRRAQPRTGAIASIETQVRLAICHAEPRRMVGERRREKRYAYPYPIYLTPIDRDGKTPLAETIVVVGKHLSEHGLDFYHREPLPFRRVIASLPCAEGQWAGLLMDLSWCRFSRYGWYDSGGRFLRLVTSPMDGAAGDEFRHLKSEV
jgi:hypothetical protein